MIILIFGENFSDNKIYQVSVETKKKIYPQNLKLLNKKIM